MSNEVYANGREIACKAASGKTVAAFPDVCLSPPSPPAGPLPVPYPNTSSASDTTNGSSTVMISGEEVMLKDSSAFKTSTGDEAATKSLGMGVITHTIQGEASFISWSMDVKIEGQNVDRHLDITIHNEQSRVAQTPPYPYVDRMAMMNAAGSDCDKERENIADKCELKDKNGNPTGKPDLRKTKCPNSSAVQQADQKKRNIDSEIETAKAANNSGLLRRLESRKKVIVKDWKKAYEDYAQQINDNPCHDAMRCAAVPYGQPGTNPCCPDQTPDHFIEAMAFMEDRNANINSKEWKGIYDQYEAPCLCVEGVTATMATHGQLSTHRKVVAMKERKMTVKRAGEVGAHAASKVFTHCSKECLEAQLKPHIEHLGAKKEISPIPHGRSASGDYFPIAKNNMADIMRGGR